VSTPAPGLIKFEIGEPQVLALAYPTGKPSKSRFTGDQLMFTTITGERFFVDPYVQDRINAAGIEVGVPFEMTKRETWQGNRRVVEFQVRKIGTSPVQSIAPAPQNVVNSNGSLPNNTPPPLPAPLPPVLPAPMNGAGETAAQVMEKCYRDAIDCALASVKYAESKGLRITPAFEDVRAMAAVLCIGQQNGGRR
jgi:hypothetical protein